jgi:hypothetical protein
VPGLVGDVNERTVVFGARPKIHCRCHDTHNVRCDLHEISRQRPRGHKCQRAPRSTATARPSHLHLASAARVASANRPNAAFLRSNSSCDLTSNVDIMSSSFLQLATCPSASTKRGATQARKPLKKASLPTSCCETGRTSLQAPLSRVDLTSSKIRSLRARFSASSAFFMTPSRSRGKIRSSPVEWRKPKCCASAVGSQS